MSLRHPARIGAAAIVGLFASSITLAQAPAPASALAPVPLASGKAALSPENTSIGFVGTHAGPKPDPRTGGFLKFTGSLEADPASKTLKAATLEIPTDAIWTQFANLTNHLKSPDFFDAREYPSASFKTTSIEPDAANPGAVAIKGELTLHGTTQPIAFPAKLAMSEAGVTLSGSFTIDRSKFGMDKFLDRVEDKVTISVAVGQKTQPLPPVAPPAR